MADPRGHPDADVTDRDLHRTISLPGVNSDPSALRGELHRVGKKVKQDLFDLALVTDEIAKTLINCNVEVDAMLGGPLPHKGVRVVYGQGKIKCSNL